MCRPCISFSRRSPRGERSQLRPFTLAIYCPKKLKRRLKPVFEAHIHRTSEPDRKNGTRIEVALEEGQVRGMLQRNLLCTGVTRGKRPVVLVGQKKAVAIAVRNVSGRRRWSKLAEWLSADVSKHYVSA